MYVIYIYVYIYMYTCMYVRPSVRPSVLCSSELRSEGTMKIARCSALRALNEGIATAPATLGMTGAVRYSPRTDGLIQQLILG